MAEAQESLQRDYGLALEPAHRETEILLVRAAGGRSDQLDHSRED